MSVSAQLRKHWHTLYSEWNIENLNSRGVLEDMECYWVHASHPIIVPYMASMALFEVKDPPQCEYYNTALPGNHIHVAKDVFPVLCRLVSYHVIEKLDDEQEIANKWKDLYSRYNKQNLREEGVLPWQNGCKFVHIDHPVVGLLRSNSNMIGTDVDSMPRVDDHIRMTDQVFDVCCSTIEEKVLNQLNI